MRSGIILVLEKGVILIYKTVCRICRAEYKTQSYTTSLINQLNFQHKHWQKYFNGLGPRYMPKQILLTSWQKCVTTKLILWRICSISSKSGSPSDFWNSAICQSYLTVTTYCTDEWNLASQVFVTREIVESHASENVTTNLKDVIREWNILNRIFLCTDASNRTLGSRSKMFKQKGTVEQHMLCLGHCMNLAAKSCPDRKYQGYPML